MYAEYFQDIGGMIAMTVREQTEILELTTLSPYACTSSGNGKRVRYEEKCPYRTEFQREIGRAHV